MSRDILIVDDEADIRELIGGLLEDEGYEARYAADADSALGAIRQRKPSLAVLDVWLQGSRLDGIELLDEIKRADPLLPVLVISGHGTIETAVAAIRKGAYDFIEKPFKSDKLLITVERALEASQLRRENAELRARSEMHNELVGQSAAMLAMRQTIDRVAPTNSRVLIAGHPGTGKELIARMIHNASHRARGGFVPVSSALMDPDRVELELFGAERDGVVERIGLLEEAHGGTLFLDEVGDMPLATQGKLLRMLVEQRFKRVGGAADVEVNVRVLSSTARDLRALIAQGRFREDLYHRLAVVPIDVPALSERRDDIPHLVEHFIERLTTMSGLPRRRIGADAMAALQAHDWPGNVRQLRNNVERLLILAAGDPDEPVTLDHLPGEVAGRSGGHSSGFDTERMIALPLRDARESFEREYLRAQINRFGGNISRTASFIGMERSALHRKLKTLGVAGPGRREDEDADTEEAS
ncbi:sigma-54-dependent Fis family transcriptional regulator [Alkalicaulis satelles]|uniref:Sigma-54-dependent Fis family transcriptional regulator n=1 Tax=Alkalicaulis satelles TaxID=2609175 RepID=A0A5M6ZLG8_9PROT|nr:sigma-54 dependent transcriptional regulator [Alkalicaulis satelles]KAA5804785.1 sigma-54-dependent Fis family transcriptional regulator [Alkalicaulis satelles]